MAHTPGKWHAKGSDVMVGRFRIVNHCTAGGAGISMDEKIKIEHDNARLMAAAPDLLAALQGVLRVADRATDEFDAARAAIKKATGVS